MAPAGPDIINLSLQFARERMKKFHSSHGWDHVERVMMLTGILLESEKNANPFIVKTSAILHDIAREDENSASGDVCHAELGSKLAYDFLLEKGLDNERASHISRCILTHRYRKDNPPTTIEAMILFDADKLDSIGAVGIGRAFLFSGEIGARLHNTDVDVTKTHAYTSEDSAYREYMFKLRHIKDRMLTTRGRELAMERHGFMEIFFQKLDEETRGKR